MLTDKGIARTQLSVDNVLFMETQSSYHQAKGNTCIYNNCYNNFRTDIFSLSRSENFGSQADVCYFNPPFVTPIPKKTEVPGNAQDV